MSDLTQAEKAALFDELFTLLDRVGVLLLDARAKHEAEAARRAKIAADQQEPWYQDWQKRKKLEDAARFNQMLRKFEADEKARIEQEAFERQHPTHFPPLIRD